MKHIVHARHGIEQAFGPPHIADVELQLVVVIGQPHIMLFLLIAAEDANLADVRTEKAAQHGIAEGARAARD